MNGSNRATKLWKTDPRNVDPQIMSEAAAVIRRGGTVAFPTETVYGLGANALDEEAVRGIFAAKGRPADNPLIVHIASIESIACLVNDVPPAAPALMNAFWPGPLTIILPKAPLVPYATTGGLETVAVRMPDHEVALRLIEFSGVPVAAPSANLSQRPSPTTAAHVIEDLWGRVDGIIDAGPTGVGVESTVIDVTGHVPIVLRPGGVTVEELRKVTPVEVDKNAHGLGQVQGKAKSPGMKYTHYAPKAPAVLVEGDPRLVPERVAKTAALLKSQGLRVGIMGTRENIPKYEADVVLDMGSHQEPNAIASNLYDILRSFDRANVDRIVIEGICPTGLGLAIMNRLRKACGGNIIHTGRNTIQTEQD